MHIAGHACSIERLRCETLCKFIAGFAESRTYASFSKENFKMNAKYKLAYKLSPSFVSTYHNQLFRRCMRHLIGDSTAVLRRGVNAMIAFCSVLVDILKAIF